jgi:hypothetical protein
VRAGVVAFQDGTAWENAKPGSCQADVQLPDSYVFVPKPCGSVYGALVRPLAASVRAPPDVVVPAVVPPLNANDSRSTR